MLVYPGDTRQLFASPERADVHDWLDRSQFSRTAQRTRKTRYGAARNRQRTVRLAPISCLTRNYPSTPSSSLEAVARVFGRVAARARPNSFLRSSAKLP